MKRVRKDGLIHNFSRKIRRHAISLYSYEVFDVPKLLASSNEFIFRARAIGSNDNEKKDITVIAVMYNTCSTHPNSGSR